MTESDIDAPDIQQDASETGNPPRTEPRSQPDGGVKGYRPRRTLPVLVELARQSHRRRTWLALGLMVSLPWLLLLAFELGDEQPSGRGMSGIATSGAVNFTMFTLYVSAHILLFMVVALFFGDTVASESTWSTLKYLLAAPVPRGRLLKQKAIASGVLTGCALALVTISALVAGSLWYGTGELVRVTGDSVPFPTALLYLAGAIAYLAIHLSWIAGLALWLSVRISAPLGAVGGAVLVSILSRILDQISALGTLRAYLPTHYATAWSRVLSTGVDWTAITYGLFSALAYAAVFALFATWHFTRKDITG